MKNNKLFRQFFRVINYLILLFLLVSSLLVNLNVQYIPLPYGVFAVVSKSMYPMLSIGDLVVTEKIDFTNINTEDVIAYKTNNQEKDVIIHRVIKKENEDEVLTKGDNNATADETLVNKNKIIGKVVKVFPEYGDIIVFMRKPLGIALFIIIPAIYLAILEINVLINHWIDHKLKNRSKPDSVTSIN